jgi:trehalose 6-phosphate phosphatase
MHHLFDYWRQVSARLRAARAVELFLDFDGTLARLRPRPEEARLSFTTRRAMARLAGNSRIRVCVITGRKLTDILIRAGVPKVRYLGLHGWDRRGRAPLNVEVRETLDRAKRHLADQIADLPGIRIEDKGPVFSVHFRGAADRQVGLARASVRTMMAPVSTELRVLEGRYAWEILPKIIGDKGTAVQRELNRFNRHALPVYVGDDRTDEPAFAVLPHGITIRVGRRTLTRAKFQLRDPAEVLKFLEKLEIELS